MENKLLSITGTEQTKEVLIALNELTLAFLKCFNGVNLASFTELWEILQHDEDLKLKIKVAYENYQLVPIELAGMDLLDSFNLVAVQLEYLKKISDALKSEPTPVPVPEPTPDPVPEPEPTPDPISVPEPTPEEVVS